jgi:UDP-N-acetylglucosamine diphosphorylase / glucose-1-phosphate thymidylyltransferase / UDP-N-acetylgalactosamine diphosphorylase / glucosamine-1-phosphate N-acetyltransferase / galactosamine-1-phosphate N-acetyltransferase
MKSALFISKFVETNNSELAALLPWIATSESETIIAKLVGDADDSFSKKDGNAIHKSATIEQGAIVKSPAFIGERCFIAAGAYLRGGVWLEQDVIIGPTCEIKSTYIFRNSKIAHLSFVGDSVIGIDVNVEAGAMIANYRNERADKEIWFKYQNEIFKTGVNKFGAIVGDYTRIGANAVIAPGAALTPGTIIKRLQLLDQTA